MKLSTTFKTENDRLDDIDKEIEAIKRRKSYTLADKIANRRVIDKLNELKFDIIWGRKY